MRDINANTLFLSPIQTLWKIVFIYSGAVVILPKINLFRVFNQVSTATALLEAEENWVYNINQGNVSAVVFLDLKKAFDTINNDSLFSKLKFYCIDGISHSWFRSYLDWRKQRCFINGSLSDCRPTTCGVPQGTILGPLLFLISINNLPNCLLNSHSRMYADDRHLTFATNTVSSIDENVHEDLPRLTIGFLQTSSLSMNLKLSLCWLDQDKD